MIHIFYPLSDARRAKATSALLNHKDVRIGQCCFTRQAGQIWAVDFSGDKTLVSQNLDIEGARQAIAWAEQKHQQNS